MQFRTAVRSISAATVAGGLTLGLGVSAPATAMPVHDRAESLGQLCHAAALARPGEKGVAPSSIEGLPGLRCGQAFGRAALAGDDTDETAYAEPTYVDATEAEDSDDSDEAVETDDAYPEQSDDVEEPEESDDDYESDEPAEESDAYESHESEDSDDSVEQDDSEESHEQEDADYDDEGDDGDDGTEHSEHHDD
jgi:hypothetical protein